MMNIDENVDDLKDYAGMTCILIKCHVKFQRYASYLTMSNFDAYKHNLKEFQCWPHLLLNMQHRWIMALVMGLLEDAP